MDPTLVTCIYLKMKKFTKGTGAAKQYEQQVATVGRPDHVLLASYFGDSRTTQATTTTIVK